MNLIKETFISGKGTTISIINDPVGLKFTLTSLQASRLLLEKSPMLFLSLLNNIQQGGVDALKALKTLHEKSPFLGTVF